MIDRQHVPALEAVPYPAIERYEIAPAGFNRVVAQRDNASVHGTIRHVRHIVDELFARRGNQKVADQYLLARRGDLQRADFAETLDARGPEKTHLVAEKLVAVERAQCLAGPVQEPLRARSFVDLDRVEGVSGPTDDAIVACGDDFCRIRQPVRARDDRPREVRLDVARGNARNRLRGERDDAHRRRQPVGVARTLKREPWLAVAAIEDDDIAGVDQVWIPDLVAIHPPHVGPAPRLLQESSRDAPKRVPSLYRVAIRWIVLQGDILRMQDAGREEERQQAGRKQQ